MGFTFKGKRSDEFKWLGIRTVKNEVIPQAKEITVESDFIDGDLDFSESSGHLKFNPRIFEKEIFLLSTNIINLNIKIKELISWLCGGYGDLILDENPDIIWNAKVSNQIDIEPQLKRAGKAVIYFKAQPLGRALEEISINLVAGENLFTNSGWYCKPILYINGQFSGLSVNLNATTLKYNASVDGDLIIDFKKMLITANDSVVTAKSTGDFGEVIQGENNIKISATGDYTAILKYYPLYLW